MRGLPRLTCLNLTHTRVGSAGALQLVQLRQLRSLSLVECKKVPQPVGDVGALPPCRLAALLPCCRAALSPCRRAALLPCRLAPRTVANRLQLSLAFSAVAPAALRHGSPLPFPPPSPARRVQSAAQPRSMSPRCHAPLTRDPVRCNRCLAWQWTQSWRPARSWLCRAHSRRRRSSSSSRRGDVDVGSRACDHQL